MPIGAGVTFIGLDVRWEARSNAASGRRLQA